MLTNSFSRRRVCRCPQRTLREALLPALHVDFAGYGAACPAPQLSRVSWLVSCGPSVTSSRRRRTGERHDTTNAVARGAQSPSLLGGVKGALADSPAKPPLTPPVRRRGSATTRTSPERSEGQVCCKPEKAGVRRRLAGMSVLTYAASTRPKSWYSTTTSKRRVRRTGARQLQTLTWVVRSRFPFPSL
jgi:hypothetical protein